MAEISAKCERYIGTAGGGMDQAIAVNAKQGKLVMTNVNPKINIDKLNANINNSRRSILLVVT